MGSARTLRLLLASVEVEQGQSSDKRLHQGAAQLHQLGSQPGSKQPQGWKLRLWQGWQLEHNSGSDKPRWRREVGGPLAALQWLRRNVLDVQETVSTDDPFERPLSRLCPPDSFHSSQRRERSAHVYWSEHDQHCVQRDHVPLGGDQHGLP